MRYLLSFLIGNALAAAAVVDDIARIESSGNHAAVGDAGKALGAWQMHRAAWDDAARRLNVRWPHTDAHDATKARAIAAEHLRWLCEQFTRKTGKQPSPADQYALWNLGLAGYAKRGWDIAKCPTITRKAVLKLEAN